MAIQLTKRAAEEVNTIMKQQEIDPQASFLRLGCVGGGCSGFSYKLDIVDNKTDLDEEFEFNGIKVVCDPKSYLYLNGTTLDFKDEIMGRGFTFNPPEGSNITKCGCGHSFSP